MKVEGQEGCDILLLQHFAVQLGVEGLGFCGDFLHAAKACNTVGNLIIVAKINTTRTMKICAPTNTTKITTVQRKLWMETTGTGTANRHLAEDLKFQKRRGHAAFVVNVKQGSAGGTILVRKKNCDTGRFSKK